MQKIIRWETPFTDSKFPSAVFFTSFSVDWKFVLKAVVSPNGLNKYPKHIVDFGEALAFTSFEEACAPERDFPTIESDKNWASACEYIDSPWLEAYELFNHGQDHPLRHYLIFGGDDNLEVITNKIPTFQTVEGPGILKIDFAI